MHAHSHTWIDPEDPPIARTPYAPVVGSLRRQMKPGRTYVCRECGHVCPIPDNAWTRAMLAIDVDGADPYGVKHHAALTAAECNGIKQ